MDTLRIKAVAGVPFLLSASVLWVGGLTSRNTLAADAAAENEEPDQEAPETDAPQAVETVPDDAAETEAPQNEEAEDTQEN